MQRAPDRYAPTLAAVCGLLACALARDVAGTLTTQKPALLLGVAALFALALARTGLARRSIGWLVIGSVCALGLPREVPTPQGRVITHAAARFTREDLFDALEQLDERPESLLGRHITVTGTWSIARAGALAAVSRRLMSCCAADAVDVGFDVVPARPAPQPGGAFVRVTGVVQAAVVDGEVRYRLTGAQVVPASAKNSAAK